MITMVKTSTDSSRTAAQNITLGVAPDDKSTQKTRRCGSGAITIRNEKYTLIPPSVNNSVEERVTTFKRMEGTDESAKERKVLTQVLESFA